MCRDQRKLMAHDFAVGFMCLVITSGMGFRCPLPASWSTDCHFAGSIRRKDSICATVRPVDCGDRWVGSEMHTNIHDLERKELETPAFPQHVRVFP